jgi:protein O-GlcNAc transferase
MTVQASSGDASPALVLTASPHFADWLLEQQISFSFTTYQTNRLFCGGVNGAGRLALHERLFDKPMGLFAQGDRLYMSSRYQLWQFDNLLSAGVTRQGCDRLYIPKTAYTTGDLNVHDVVLDGNGALLFVNTDFSCLAQLSPDYSFEPIWQPPFISKLVAEDRCHLNGLALRDGQPAYVTVCSSTDTAAGWRDHRVKGGAAIDVQTDEIVAAGLSMPHSPRWYQGKLWLLNSGTGELGHIDLPTGQFRPLTFCPGFVRGLAFWQNFALVGLSQLRAKPFSGLALEARLTAAGQTAQCGLMVVDLNTGQAIHWLQLEGVVEELFDVVVLPGVRQPQVLGFQSEDIERLVTFPGSGGIVTTKPTVKRPSVGDRNPIAGLPRQVWEGEGEHPTAPSTPPPTDSPIKFQRVFHLNAESLAPYTPFTYPSLQQRWQTQPQRGELLGTSASVDGEMVAFAIAELWFNRTAEIISLFVTSNHRHQGIATRLIAYLERQLQAEGCVQAAVTYQPTALTGIALEPLLTRLGWQEPDTLQNGDRHSVKRLSPTPSHFEQGKALAQQGNLAGAVHCFREAIRLQTDSIVAYNQLGNALQRMGQLEEAISAYQQLLALNPNVAEAHSNLGVIWQLQGKTAAAIAAYQKAIQLKPDFALAHLNLGRLYLSQSAWLEAKQALQEAIRLQPEAPDAYTELAQVLHYLGRTEKAIALLQGVLERQPDTVIAQHTLGCLWMGLGEMAKAQQCFEAAIARQPDFLPVHGNLGQALEAQGQLNAALASYHRALELNPQATELLFQREHLRLTLCDWQDYDQRLQTLQQRLETHLQDETAPALLPLSVFSFPLPLSLQAAVARHWSRRVSRNVQSYGHLCNFSPPPAPASKLRLGYLSGDFREHAVGTLIYEIFQYHDLTQFEVYAYSLSPVSDAYTERIRVGCDHFVDLSPLSSATAAQRIHQDGIHILIDLSGYTTFSRPEILALRPAPVQVQYLGYPGTMMAEFVPYILADCWLIPPELAPYYSEQVIELPHAFVASPLPIADPPLIRADFGLPTGAFVFCCFNRSDKVDPTVFAAWMRILRQVPRAVLWLIETTPAVSETLRQRAQQQGIDPTQLVFTPRMPLPQYLAAYRLADLFLDTFVYNAGATAIHALSSGLPVLTRPGEAFVARMGASISASAGLEMLIAGSSAAYEQTAVHLATHPNELATLRQALQRNLATLPLFQPQQWVAHLEAALWQCWAQSPTVGLPPETS